MMQTLFGKCWFFKSLKPLCVPFMTNSGVDQSVEVKIWNFLEQILLCGQIKYM